MGILLEHLRLEEKQFKVFNSLIKVSGPDSEQYLQSQTTNDVAKLENKTFQFNSILDISGKIITSFILLKENNLEFFLLLDKSNLKLSIDRIEKYHIAEDFEVEGIEKDSFLTTNSSETEFSGQYFFPKDSISFVERKEILGNKDDLLSLQVVLGIPDLNSDTGVLINNTLLDELSVNYSKGCYPGQETVSKVNTRRGAAYKPVLCVLKSEVHFDDFKITSNNKKIGEIKEQIVLNGKTYLSVSLLREYRVDKSKLKFECSTKEYIGVINYFPFFGVTKADLAQDLYDFALESFLNGNNEVAIEYFNKAISADAKFEDAYEGLGVLFGRLENYEKAIDLMEQLKNINPKCMMALTNLSLYHMKVGNIDTAEKYKSDATMLNFELLGDEAETKRRLEDLKQKKLNDMARRKSMFVQVLEMDSEDAMANNGMGEIEFEQGEFLVAQGYFEQAIKFNTKYSVAYLGLAKSLYFQNEKYESKLILEKGINVASKNGDLMPANEMQALLAKLIM